MDLRCREAHRPVVFIVRSYHGHIQLLTKTYLQDIWFRSCILHVDRRIACEVGIT